MRKLIVTLAAGVTALAVAAPAAAQYYPQPAQPYGYGYGAPHYDYRSQSYGLEMRADALTRRIYDLRRAHVLRGDRAEQLSREARSLQRRIRQASVYGFGGIAASDLQMRVSQLEQRVAWAASRGRYGGYNRGSGYNGYNNGYGSNAYAHGYGQQGYGQRDREDDDRYDRGDDDRYERDNDD